MASSLPDTFHAQLATLVEEAPEGPEWLHEIKYDGYRIGCRIDRGDVRLITRNGNDWTAHFPTVRTLASQIKADTALLDGEVAVVLPDGRTSFQALQNMGTASQKGHLVYFLFDALHLNGRDLTSLPLEERKAILHELVTKRRSPAGLQYSEHVTGSGRAFLREVCRLKLEGIVSKRRDLPYRPGRHGGWVKTKCVQRQEFTIGGFTDPEGSRAGLGALLIGYYRGPGERGSKGRDKTAGPDDKLVFAGKVGTGFTQNLALDLRRKLDALEQPSCPFDPPPAGPLRRHAHWTRPMLVAEVAFAEWTGDGKIRHPSFQGLREDKKASAIVAEAPIDTTGEHPTPAKSPRSSTAKRTRPLAPSVVRRPPAGAIDIAGVRITHPDRVLYPEAGVTKANLARYFEHIADWILPHLRGRPLTLVRCPEGLSKDCFYMKHANVWAPPALKRVNIRERTKVGEYLVADSVEGLVSLAQMGILEIHTWNSTLDHLEEPDRVVLDIDPGPDVLWVQVVETARLVRQILATVGLDSFVKTTGSRGLHVAVPLAPKHTWEECLDFSRAVAQAIERSDPARYTTTFRKAGRERKLLIDYLRNNRTNTSVAAYSTRAKPRASVSAPLTWRELSPDTPSDYFTINTIQARLSKRKKDPWQDYWRLRQRIGKHAREALDALGL